MSGPPSLGPLDGLVVLDLTSMLAGPYTTMILGDLGARIIKIEPPDGDMVRASARLPGDDDRKSFGGYFQSINRNKQSIVLDLKTEAAKNVFRRMVRDADVVVENYRAGVMSRLGLDYEDLKELNPRLVYGALRGFGDARTGKSPYERWPAFDVVAQAMGGIMGITGPKGGAPLKVGAGIGDTVPGLFLAVGLLAAHHRVQRTGEAQFVDVGMYDSVLAVCERIIYQNSYLGENPAPEGDSHPLLSPFGVFPATDGHIAIGCPRDHFWRQLVEKMGRAELADDARYKTNEDRVRHRREVDEIVGRWTRDRSKESIMETLGGIIPIGPVNRAADIVADPHVAARNMLATVEQPGPEGGDVRIVNCPIHFLESPSGVRHRAARLGEDTAGVLAGFGYSEQEIRELYEIGAVA